jgi:hypothetical protein
MAILPVSKDGPDIGECIYCGSRDTLSREHAIPYGLNGPWTLQRANCAACAAITSGFEQDALRNLFQQVRTVLGLQTRRQKGRPQSLPLVLETAGIQKTVQVALADFPLYLPAPVLPPPGALVGRAPSDWPPPRDLHLIRLAGPSFEEVATRHPGVDFVGTRLRFSPDAFARTLAKTGFCAAVYALGIGPLRESPLRRIVTGHDPYVGHWVGSWMDEPVNTGPGLHGIQVMSAGADIHVVVRLFGQFGGSEYHVVVGPADPEFVESEAWPWK